MLTDHEDAFGHGMLDYLNGTAASEMVERDDGLIRTNGGPAIYFQPFNKWHPLERKAMRHVAGRVLDIGCGAGRHSLYLQDRGYDVVAIDNSPLAIETSMRRGVRDARVVSISDIDSSLGTFDTILLLGGNFGLLGNPQRARRLLKRLHRLTASKGRIITASGDPRTTDDPDHLAYHAANIAKGKLPGQMRIRVRYKRYATPWIEFFAVSRQDLEQILEGTGWAVSRYLSLDAPPYVAMIGKT
jgi:SAM-dependent methyltransferase